MLPGQRLLRRAFPNSFKEECDASVVRGGSDGLIGARRLAKEGLG